MFQPLADQLRPQSLEDVVGQEHLLAEGGFLKSALKRERPVSILFWGPPGCGKTSLARLYAQAFSLSFRSLNATFSGVADLKKIVKEIQDVPILTKGVLLFVDEIHRFNKAQQDAFLPYVENGMITLVGATAENPSFYLNDALLSRMTVLQLYSLDAKSLEKIWERYEKKHRPLLLDEEAKKFVISLAQGDGRYLLNLMENLEALSVESPVGIEEVEAFLQKRPAFFDKSSDQHYNLISALHKSVRGSDPDAALYWFCRMIEGGEDPRYLARRLIRMATEDIGLADPQALPLAVAARDSYEMLGSPEGELGLAEVVIYLALAPKSNTVYIAYKKARAFAAKTTQYEPPKHILNGVTKLMKQFDYGKGYHYDHEAPGGCSGQHYFPEALGQQSFYYPVERGFEREMHKRLAYYHKKRFG